MNLKFKRLNELAVKPRKAHESDGAYDLVATSKEFDAYGNLVYGTGLALEIPEGYVAKLYPRSSVKSKDLMLVNSVGIIDSGYRGEVKVVFKKLGDPFMSERYSIGDRVAQLRIEQNVDVVFCEESELSDSARGVGGFGSTGV